MTYFAKANVMCTYLNGLRFADNLFYGDFRIGAIYQNTKNDVKTTAAMYGMHHSAVTIAMDRIHRVQGQKHNDEYKACIEWFFSGLENVLKQSSKQGFVKLF